MHNFDISEDLSYWIRYKEIQSYIINTTLENRNLEKLSKEKK